MEVGLIFLVNKRLSKLALSKLELQLLSIPAATLSQHTPLKLALSEKNVPSLK